jgi:hypothetical protein
MMIYRSRAGWYKTIEGPGVIIGYDSEIQVPTNMVKVSFYNGEEEVHLSFSPQEAKNLAKSINDYADGEGWR